MTAIVIPDSANSGEPAIACPETTGADKGDRLLALPDQELADLAEQAADAVAHAARAEPAETGQVATDLTRVQMRIGGQLFRRDPSLACLPCLG